MVFNPQHYGLTFNDVTLEQVKSSKQQTAITDALALLDNIPDDQTLQSAYLMGLRHRFREDADSGQRCVEWLRQMTIYQLDDDYGNALRQVLAWLNMVESIRDLSSWQAHQSAWFDQLRQILAEMNNPPESATLLDQLWLGALNIGAGIVLDDETIFTGGADIYQQMIAHHIHPEGYLKGIVDDEEAKIDTFAKQVSGTSALILMAEMAEIAGVDLWSINNRGITPMTAATYILYYYYYPEKWKWESNLTIEQAESIMHEQGAFIEIPNRRSHMRAIEQLLDDQRPFFNVYYGGLTTLTHGIPAPPLKKKRWGIF